MPRDLVYACAAMACLRGHVAEGLAMLLSGDCWLRISEVAGLTPRSVVDTRGQSDAVGRGVSVFLPEAKTGRRQAVQVADPDVAVLLVAWAEATRRSAGGDAPLFPQPHQLRAALDQSLAVFADGTWDTRGLVFVWHSFRHGGASRASLAGQSLDSIIIRGRWAVESSGRHYVQAGRQMLLALALPSAVTELASRLIDEGLACLVDPNLRDRLRR